MYKIILIILFFTISVNAQTKKSTSKIKKEVPVKDSVVAAVIDTFDLKEEEIRDQPKFAVYSKKAKVTKDKRMKLCFNLVNEDTTVYLFYCFNDSICKDPEVYNILFREIKGDSTYLLIYVDAVTKVIDKPSCDSGHETKLLFVRWNTQTNKAIWKQKNISSCMKGITNMTKDPIAKWDGTSPLIVNYHRGGVVFEELKFDPQNFLLGLQSNNEAESK